MAASKWIPPISNSRQPLVAPDGTVSEPPSGRFDVVCRPEEGGEGIQRAIRDCRRGGSILLIEGVYLVTRVLRVNRRVHIFGRGKAELRRLGTRDWDMIRIRSSDATLDQLRIDNRTAGDSYTLVIDSGHLRLQGCDVSARIENGTALLWAFGSRADVLGCTFSCGGGDGILFSDGASGRIEGCDIRGCDEGAGIHLEVDVTSTLVTRNTIRDCEKGVLILDYLDPSWSLGEGNIFINCSKGDVVSEIERVELSL